MNTESSEKNFQSFWSKNRSEKLSNAKKDFQSLIIFQRTGFFAAKPKEVVKLILKLTADRQYHTNNSTKQILLSPVTIDSVLLLSVSNACGLLTESK